MHEQPRHKPYSESSFFADGMASRPRVTGTVPRGRPADGPVAVDRDLLLRGRERYGIFCTPCHDAVGSGKGTVVRRGYRPPPSFHEERLRAATPGHVYDVITNGFGAMPDHAAQIPPRDRWAIAAYLRALQLSQRASRSDVPPEALEALEAQPR